MAVKIVNAANATLMLAYDNASKTSDETITRLWGIHTSIHDVDDPLIKILKDAIKQREESGGKTGIGGYVQGFINDNPKYVPPANVKHLYDALLTNHKFCQLTMTTARKEFDKTVTYDILYDYHMEMRKTSGLNYDEIDDDVY